MRAGRPAARKVARGQITQPAGPCARALQQLLLPAAPLPERLQRHVTDQSQARVCMWGSATSCSGADADV